MNHVACEAFAIVVSHKFICEEIILIRKQGVKKGPQRGTLTRKIVGGFSPRSQIKSDNKVIIMWGYRKKCKLLMRVRQRLRQLIISRAVWRERNWPSDSPEYQFHTSAANVSSRKLLLCCHQPRQKVLAGLNVSDSVLFHPPTPPTPTSPLPLTQEMES